MLKLNVCISDIFRACGTLLYAYRVVSIVVVLVVHQALQHHSDVTSVEGLIVCLHRRHVAYRPLDVSRVDTFHRRWEAMPQ